MGLFNSMGYNLNCHFGTPIVLVLASWSLFKLALYPADTSLSPFKYFLTFCSLRCPGSFQPSPAPAMESTIWPKVLVPMSDFSSNEPPETRSGGLFSHFFDLPLASWFHFTSEHGISSPEYERTLYYFSCTHLKEQSVGESPN